MNKTQDIKYCKCGQLLDALHMGDVDPDLCIVCERKIISSAETEVKPIVIWERNTLLQ